MAISRRSRLHLSAAVLALALTVTLAGMLGSGTATGNRAPGESGPQIALAQAPRTQAEVGVVVGRLRPQPRARAVRKVSRTIDRWIDAAYVEGRYPRRRFAGAFRTFSPDLRRQARRDRMLLTNADLGAKVDGVTVRQRRVRVDLLATRGRARTATAHVRLRFDTEGPRTRRVTVSGRLFLTKTKRGWHVIGYDLRKGRR